MGPTKSPITQLCSSCLCKRHLSAATGAGDRKRKLAAEIKREDAQRAQEAGSALTQAWPAARKTQTFPTSALSCEVPAAQVLPREVAHSACRSLAYAPAVTFTCLSWDLSPAPTDIQCQIGSEKQHSQVQLRTGTVYRELTIFPAVILPKYQVVREQEALISISRKRNLSNSSDSRE